jgi:hypothetical protein
MLIPYGLAKLQKSNGMFSLGAIAENKVRKVL